MAGSGEVEKAAVASESVQSLTTENTTLKHRVRQLSREHRTLQERLEGAQSNVRFAEKRIADLEAELIERPRIWVFQSCRESTALAAAARTLALLCACERA
ncbi:hypothetical protein [Kitasatospora camelliae]|uniref:Uncharacterized protein n=1 Tax=Kitasatospora camelliae TaxID=3156397 RepID=A0AAU8K529_9ACTN